jgi:hypothetical protein
MKLPCRPAHLLVLLVPAVLSSPPLAGAQPCFLADGKILSGNVDGSAPAGKSKPVEIAPASPVSAVWGTLADGRILATLAQQHDAGPDPLEGHSHDSAGPLAAISESGACETLITSDVLRAFPSPAGDAVAAITPDRELLLLRAPAQLTVTHVTGKVSHATWSPEGKRLAAAVYPPDFSPHAMDNPRSSAHFLALQNSDIYLLDSSTGAVLSQLTSSPGTDYNPFFSPDGTSLYYVWLHETENAGGLMRLALDKDAGTSASAPAQPVTQAGYDSGKVPLGRVGTYTFANAGASLVFEAGRPDGSGEIWSMQSTGKAAHFIAEGRKPQLQQDGSIAILTPAKQVRALTAKELEQ